VVAAAEADRITLENQNKTFDEKQMLKPHLKMLLVRRG
jgi:hypothetical protein